MILLLLSMIQQLKNTMFKQFEPQQYYRRYFQHLHKREDGRQLQQSRPLQITLNSLASSNGNCILRKGNLIIMCEIIGQAQQLSINPLTNEFSIPLISVTTVISEKKEMTYIQKLKKESYLSNWLLKYLKDINIQSQLFKQINSNKYYGYVINIKLRVLTQDGALVANSLLALQFALLSTKLKNISYQADKIVYDNNVSFNLAFDFAFPINYCEIFQNMLIDPNQDEEDHSSYSISFIWNLRNQTYRIEKLGKQEVNWEVIKSLLQLSKIEISKLKINLAELQQQASKNQVELQIQ